MARTEEIILDFEVDTGDSVQSINDLTKANKELREERNKLNIQSKEGQQRLKEINSQLDANSTKIKENVSALEKQKINIGNYRSALDGVHPALGKLSAGLDSGAQGFKAMTLQALRFIATPIGAILAAIVAVFTLLKAAVSQNNEILDKFENITNAVGVVLNVIISRVGKLGEALIALATGDFDKAIDLTAQAFGGLADEIGNALTQGQLYLDLSRDLEDAQRALRIETAKQENEIKRLVVAAKNRSLTLDEQEQLLRKALALEQQLVAKRAENAQKDLVITAKRIALDRELSQTSEETFDEFVTRLVESSKLGDEQVDEIITKIEALEQARGSSLAFQEKVENNLSAIQEKRALALEKQNAALAEQAALREANARAASEEVRSAKDGVKREDRPDELSGAFATQLDKQQELEITENFNERINQANNEAYLEDVRNKHKAEQTKLALQEAANSQSIETRDRFIAAGLAIADRESAVFKAFATAQTLISTAQTAQLAYKSAFLPIATVASPALGAINAALAVAQGLAQVAAINGVEFAEGGWTGPGGKYEPKGIVHGNEVVWNTEDVMAVGGPHVANAMRPTYGRRQGIRGEYFDGGLTTNSISTPINQQLEIANVIKNLPPPVVGVKEVTKMQNRVRVKEQASKR